MKWMIASDLHGSAFYCKKMIKAFERERADRLLLLGDLLYHGPRNDLPEGYAPKEVIPLLNGLKPALLCVRGNCDAEVDQMVLDFPILADYAVLPVGRRLVYATHGHVHNLKNLPPLAPGDVLLHVIPVINFGLFTFPVQSVSTLDTPDTYLFNSSSYSFSILA